MVAWEYSEERRMYLQANIMVNKKEYYLNCYNTFSMVSIE